MISDEISKSPVFLSCLLTDELERKQGLSRGCKWGLPVRRRIEVALRRGQPYNKVREEWWLQLFGELPPENNQ